MVPVAEGRQVMMFLAVPISITKLLYHLIGWGVYPIYVLLALWAFGLLDGRRSHG